MVYLSNTGRSLVTHKRLNKLGIKRHKDGNRLGLRKRKELLTPEQQELFKQELINVTGYFYGAGTTMGHP
jgi:hypothetical protein